MPEPVNPLSALVTALCFSTGLFFILGIRAFIQAFIALYHEHKEDARIDRINTNALK